MSNPASTTPSPILRGEKNKESEQKPYIDEFDEENEDDTYEPEPLEYDANQINVTLWQPTIFQVLRRIDQKILDLAPKFQRHAGIWKREAKSRLIESILIRIPLPAFYIDASNEEDWKIVDGLQRLTALKDFCKNKFPLKELEYLRELEDKFFKDIAPRYKTRIEDYQITVYRIEKGTSSQVRYNIFHRINTGGEPLTSQEIRHVVNSSGKAPDFLEKLSQNQDFIDTTNIGKSQKKRMQDREFILHFLAFKITKYTEYEPGMRKFLDEAMFKLNQQENIFESLEEQFEKAMEAAKNIFGFYAFRKRLKIDEIMSGDKQPKYENRPNKALFEVWAVSLSELHPHDIEKLRQYRRKLIDKFNEKLTKDIKFYKSISQLRSQKDAGVIYRFRTIKELIKGVLR